MPELAAIYFLGLVVCAALAVLFIFLVRRRRRIEPYVTLVKNLKTAGYYWSEHEDRIVPWSESTVASDRAASERTIALTGILLSPLSWAGAGFLILIMVSYRFLARSRREIVVFASRLASEPNLTADEVRRLIDELTDTSGISAQSSSHEVS